MGAHIHIDGIGLPKTAEFIAKVERGEFPMIGVPHNRPCPRCKEPTRKAVCEHCGARYDWREGVE